MRDNQAAWTTGTVSVDGVRLSYDRTGPPGRSVLVLLHGITDDGRCWSRVARDLEAEFDILMPDARGHGRSEGIASGFSVPRLAADLAGLLDGLGISDALLFGHSMGAITAAALAASRPDLVRACVLEDPPLGELIPISTEALAAMRADAAMWRTLPPDERHELAALRNPGWDLQESEPWADAKAMVDLAVIDQFGTFDVFDWPTALTEMRCPGLLLTGDPALGALVTPETSEEAVRLWPAGRVVRVDGAGHCIHRDRWEATMAPVRAFLRAHASTSTG
jgi:pimeloyl-ACP methyl ester carboxylesterase